MPSTQKQILLLAGITLLLGGMAWFGRPRNEVASPASVLPSPRAAAPLVADMPSFDFGTISMANGIVRHSFAVKNAGDIPVTVRQVYTSCMCTEATLLVAGGRRIGPFGMPGHGMPPSINREFAPGEEATIEVAFDPAAHGPAGVGMIERLIYLETDGGPFVLRITANVTP